MRMNLSRYAIALVAGCIAAMVPLGCFPGDTKPAAYTVPGAESDTLLAASSGNLLYEDSQTGQISVLALPSLTESYAVAPLLAKPADSPTFHALSGPDDRGRVAYIEDHFFVEDEKTRHHSLKIAMIGLLPSVTLFTRPGDAMWAISAAGHGEIGEGLALSPTHGRVAFVSGTSGEQMPSALLTVGTIEIWDIEKRTGAKTDIRSVDESFTWFPDGNRLAYTKLIPAETPGLPSEGDAFRKSFPGWKKLPAVFIRDVAAGGESMLQLGMNPIVSSDGQTVLVSDLQGHSREIDVNAGGAKDVTLPGRVIALLDANTVLTWAYPTAGATITYTKNYSPLVGPKQILSVKLSRLDTGEFKTVIPELDPHRLVSFGVGRPVVK